MLKRSRRLPFAATLFAALAVTALLFITSALLTSCPMSMLEKGDSLKGASFYQPPRGMGSVRLLFDDTQMADALARATLPDPATINSFEQFWLQFTPVPGTPPLGGTGKDVYPLLAHKDDYIDLLPGTYTLDVIGYKTAGVGAPPYAPGDEPTNPAAAATVTGIVITYGYTEDVTVTLKPIINGTGSGTLTWDLDTSGIVGAITKAEIDITPIGTGTTVSGKNIAANLNNTSSPESLLSGYYAVNITVRIAQEAERTYRRIAHVYQNMNSTLDYTFPDENIWVYVDVPVGGGTFTMGNDLSLNLNEKPEHSVKISNGFLMGKYEVTQKQWNDVMDSNPSESIGDHLPVEKVTWYEAIIFCNKLSIKENLTPVYTIDSSTDPDDWGTSPTTNDIIWDAVTADWTADGYRLPTEAEWEFAARGGQSLDYTYSGSNTIGDVAWYNGNSGGVIHEVGQKTPNDLRIYDMSGNVFEWCWDWYQDNYYSVSPNADPKGADQGDATPDATTLKIKRTERGGRAAIAASEATVSRRNSHDPGDQLLGLGLRIVRGAHPSAPSTTPVTGVTLDNTTLSIQSGNTATLTATVAPAGATNKTVTWSSDDTTVATVDSSGEITAAQAGTATITVTTADGSYTATCVVTVFY